MHKLIGVSKIVIKNDEGEALLLLRGSTAPSRPLTWDLPGGIIEANEEASDAAIRETSEEVGFDISDYDLTKIDKYKDYKYCWTVYETTVTNPKVEISWEHDEFKWASIKELKQTKNMPGFLKNIVLNALKGSMATD